MFLGACEGGLCSQDAEGSFPFSVFALVVESNAGRFVKARPPPPVSSRDRGHFHLQVSFLDETVKLNFPKSRPLKTRLSSSPREEMGSAWQSRGACWEGQASCALTCKVNGRCHGRIRVYWRNGCWTNRRCRTGVWWTRTRVSLWPMTMLGLLNKN